MLVYGLDAEAAFSLLSWQSQRSNIKLRDLAERLVAVVGGDAHASAAIRQRLDEIVYSLPAGPAAASPAAGQPDDDLLAVDLQTVDGAVVLHLRGEVDMATRPLPDQHLTRAVALVSPPAPLVVDLSRVQHLGSVGAALLATCHRRCQTAGTRAGVVGSGGRGLVPGQAGAVRAGRPAPEPGQPGWSRSPHRGGCAPRPSDRRSWPARRGCRAGRPW